MIAIIDSCGANIASVQFALERLGKQAILTSDSAIIRTADHVILPGVGTAQNAMEKLAERDLVTIIQKLDQPVLGICLGMQLFYQSSEEGNVKGLGVVAGDIKLFPKSPDLVVPHMGWNKLNINNNSKLLNNINTGDYVYYVHSYFAPINDNTTATTQYGENFTAMVEKDNFYGVQFHPERSGEVGEQILRNFLNL
ncbi:MAG TPA: imidazole glycerol phosphate synthase subunit HisH [Gammaproteobacteria bacterium]|nr:imidazole glycerol phosphate synthase subunit HisH [Gammaproteobacteria bacterium]